MKTMNPDKLDFATLCVHGSGAPVSPTGAISVPIFQTSTFAFRDLDTAAQEFAGEKPGYIYSRLQNPTTEAFEREVAFLEHAEASAAFASGMAAVAMTLLALARPGDKILSTHTVYGGTHALFEEQLKKFDIEVIYADSPDAAEFAAKMDSRVKAVFIETPANPTLAVLDIAAIAGIAHDWNVPLIVDNTFATPYYQSPLQLGADIVLHSTTKYIGGHGDAIGGVVAGSKTFIDDLRSSGLKELGAIMSPFTAWLMLRGLKTLPVRMDRSSENAMQVAKFLDGHEKVSRVHYPGLQSHPGHDIARRQMRGFSGVLAFELHGGFPAAERMLNAVNLISLAVSLGDCDTLIEHPASMTHSSYSPEERRELGISDGLVRLSVGLEGIDDLLADLQQALDKA
ncbi:MAG TPA: aminotransferase class I/II-fold pyridoxal phosphate-dependent enzyme [Bacteroidetes bacterium]|nr:aminotransferase class I/II-fold pyridoxal phosphate-dependent enzyme [Bacteroidota bacterium]